MNIIGKKIRDILRKNKISLYRVAKDLGIAKESLHRSLTNGGNPEWNTIKRVVDYLDYEVKLTKRRKVSTYYKREIRPRKNRILIPFTLIFVFLFGSLNAQETDRVKRVIDGDTILLTNGERVRLIGVDTPETKHPQKPVQYFGKEAYLFTKRMVEGKEVRLEYDWQRRDKYGRLLAYVYLLDGTFLNAEIIKQGYGFAYTRFPFKYLDEFRGYEREAREKGRGLWEKN